MSLGCNADAIKGPKAESRIGNSRGTRSGGRREIFWISQRNFKEKFHGNAGDRDAEAGREKRRHETVRFSR